LNEYRYVRLFIKFGPACALLCVVLSLAISIWSVAQGISSLVGAAVYTLLGMIVGFLVMVLVDLARLIADMLLPR